MAKFDDISHTRIVDKIQVIAFRRRLSSPLFFKKQSEQLSCKTVFNLYTVALVDRLKQKLSLKFCVSDIVIFGRFYTKYNFKTTKFEIQKL